MKEQSDTLVRDRLARHRTEMANERTLLSYIRTALGFIAVGIPAVWWFEGPVIQTLGVVSLLAGVTFIGIGVHRFLTAKAAIAQQPD